MKEGEGEDLTQNGHVIPDSSIYAQGSTEGFFKEKGIMRFMF